MMASKLALCFFFCRPNLVWATSFRSFAASLADGDVFLGTELLLGLPGWCVAAHITPRGAILHPHSVLRRSHFFNATFNLGLCNLAIAIEGYQKTGSQISLLQTAGCCSAEALEKSQWCQPSKSPRSVCIIVLPLSSLQSEHLHSDWVMDALTGTRDHLAPHLVGYFGLPTGMGFLSGGQSLPSYMNWSAGVPIISGISTHLSWPKPTNLSGHGGLGHITLHLQRLPTIGAHTLTLIHSVAVFQ